MSIKTWSEAQEEELVSLYVEQNIKDIEILASHFNKNRRSVISKLVQLRVYIKPQSIKEDNVTVKGMLRDLETMLGIQIDGINLNKKENLFKIVEAMKERLT